MASDSNSPTKLQQIENQIEKAEGLEATSPNQAIEIYRAIADDVTAEKTEEFIKLKESAIYKLAKLLAKKGDVKQLGDLMTQIRPFFDTVSKARTAKIVRTLIEITAEIPNTQAIQIELCKDSIKWSKETSRNFLRHRIEARLAALYLETRQYPEALEIINNLLREVKKMDDKLLLLEIQLTESKIHLALRNLAKAKAALTSARANANSIYCPPALAAQMDLQGGILHAEERDYKTAYSYFFESFETFSNLEDPRALSGLKYMLLTKIMNKNTEDMDNIIAGKAAAKYAGREVEAMRAVAKAYSHRALEEFEQAKAKFPEELTKDAIIHTHLSELYDTLLEQNLLRLVEPFSVVEVAHIAKLIKLDITPVENKLSQMILDKKLEGILDQGLGHLIIYERSQEDKTYKSAIGITDNMSTVVDTLYSKAMKINQS